MSENTINRSSIAEIIDFLRNDFPIQDNIPEDLSARNAICMNARASILIDSYCCTGRFPAFMKAGRHDNQCWIYKLEEPIRHEVEEQDNNNIKWKYYLEFSEFAVHTGNMLEADSYGQKGRWRLRIENCLGHHVKGVNLNNPMGYNGKSYAIDALKTFHSHMSSKFNICKHITPYNTPEKACRFFGNESAIFAPLKLNSSTLHNDIFIDAGNGCSDYMKELRQSKPNFSEEALVECILRDITCNAKELDIISTAYEKAYGGWCCLVYCFKNEYSDVVMKVIKFYNQENQTKCLIPVTSWIRNYSTRNQIFCVPVPHKQPLFNLDLLTIEDDPIVILTDSIEIADACQRNASLPGVVFTSFLCDHGQYHQVDFKPLEEALEVYYLITNHSGNKLETAYLKAEQIAEHLQEEYDISLKFIQMKVDYSPQNRRKFNSVADVVAERIKTPPGVNTKSICIMNSEDEFDAQYQKALKEINEYHLEWWEMDSLSETNTEQKHILEESAKCKPINYVIFPILIKGEGTMIHARKGTGKSAFVISMAAAAVCNSQRAKAILKEKWWVASKHNYEMNKVLYLDFENGSNESERRESELISPYLPLDERDRLKCRNNLIIKDLMKSEKIDYSLPVNHQKIFDMLEEAKNNGIKGQPVDLLIIDTYTKFVRTETPQTSTNFSDLLNKIRSMNIAVLILHHSNEEGQVRGFKSKIDDLYVNISMYRESDEFATLETPCWIKFQANRGATCEKLIAPFQVKMINREWLVHEPERTETEELKIIATAYKKRGYNRSIIASMLGMSKSSLQEKLKAK